MPSYDYQCPANGQVIEVKHSISESVKNWGELCERAGIELGDTLANSPVEKLITGSNVVKKSSLGSEPPCGSGPCCGGGGCGL